MVDVARTLTAAELAARNVTITIVHAGLTAPRVDFDVPASLSDAVRAALAWRVEAMRKQVRAAVLSGRSPTLVAVPDLVLPKLKPVRHWKQVETRNRIVPKLMEAQRVVPGLCASCGEACPHETGDCILCNAARIGALRAEGRLPAPEPLAVPTYTTDAAWAAMLRVTPPYAPPVRVVVGGWTCRVCNQRQDGFRRPDDECGPCEYRRQQVVDLSNLGGRAA